MLSLAEREEISRGLASGDSMRAIATRLGRATSTVSREVNRNGGRKDYRATVAEERAWHGARRPKRCLLAMNDLLRDVLANKLKEDCSPEQISGWLKRRYPDDEAMRVSHETIYRTLVCRPEAL
jgi:IS30 family transposase